MCTIVHVPGGQIHPTTKWGFRSNLISVWNIFNTVVSGIVKKWVVDWGKIAVGNLRRKQLSQPVVIHPQMLRTLSDTFEKSCSPRFNIGLCVTAHLLRYAVVTQLGECKTEDLEVAGSSPARGTILSSLGDPLITRQAKFVGGIV